MHEVYIEILGYDDSDAEERAQLAGSLERDLHRSDVERVDHPPVPSADGAKGTALEWAQLIVTVVGSLPPAISTIREWLNRHSGASIALELDGDRLELTGLGHVERDALVELWVRRHEGK
jgi:Effector Associated Constant Component 1